MGQCTKLHLTETCTKSRGTDVNCTGCSGQHPANYRVQALSRNQETTKPQFDGPHRFKRNGMSFADKIKTANKKYTNDADQLTSP